MLRGPLVQVGLQDMGHTTAGYGGTPAPAGASPRHCSELLLYYSANQCFRIPRLELERCWKGTITGLAGQEKGAGKNSLMGLKRPAGAISPKTIFVYPKEP